MKILGLETSCDETASAILQQNESGIHILSNVVASSLELQAKWGGVVPEQAAREQIKSIIPVITEALNVSRITYHDLDAIAVTQGPGLIGSLLVGVETAKTLSLVWHKPLIPVNHLIGHFYANWIQLDDSSFVKSKNKATTTQRKTTNEIPNFPCLGLLVSGGHTDLVLFENHGQYKYLGGTRDDAAGECFDKCARLLGLPYPGGPQISKHAKVGNPHTYKLPIPMQSSNDLDFSFSGLKTAVSNLVNRESLVEKTKNDKRINDMCASIEDTIIKSLVQKTLKAAKIYQVSQIMVAGGVAANQKLRDILALEIRNSELDIKLFIPTPKLCTDNAAMIASAAFFLKPEDPLKIEANPNLSLAY